MAKKAGDKNLHEDLFGYGMIGLIKAIDNYDPSKSALSTYAKIKVEGAIIDGYRRMEFFSHARRTGNPVKLHMLGFALIGYDNDKNYNAEECEGNEYAKEKTRQIIRLTSSEEERYSLEDLLSKLHPRQREILTMRFFDEENLADIGKKFCRTEAWASMQVKDAIKRLRIIVELGDWEEIRNYGTKKERANFKKFRYSLREGCRQRAAVARRDS
jgi:RNA polymerase sigma factor for flagellar operon FliA